MQGRQVGLIQPRELLLCSNDLAFCHHRSERDPNRSSVGTQVPIGMVSVESRCRGSWRSPRGAFRSASEGIDQADVGVIEVAQIDAMAVGAAGGPQESRPLRGKSARCAARASSGATRTSIR